MTLEEAIRHAEEVVNDNEEDAGKWTYTINEYKKRDDWDHSHTINECAKALKKCKECAAEHRQLAEWLTELKEFRERNEKMCEVLSEKLAYMNTCLNEREIILGIACGKQRSGINHCNTDCQNTACEAYHH